MFVDAVDDRSGNAADGVDAVYLGFCLSAMLVGVS
jgi:hypothetical protein